LLKQLKLPDDESTGGGRAVGEEPCCGERPLVEAWRVAVPRLSRLLSAEFAEIIAWYEDLLERTYPPVDLVWEPVKIGPTWQYDNGWSLPDHTLGWRVLAWCGVWLRDKTGKPWQFTAEQARFVLWFFALDETATSSTTRRCCNG
jgi:hypothetical protein